MCLGSRFGECECVVAGNGGVTWHQCRRCRRIVTHVREIVVLVACCGGGDGDGDGDGDESYIVLSILGISYRHRQRWRCSGLACGGGSAIMSGESCNNSKNLFKVQLKIQLLLA